MQEVDELSEKIKEQRGNWQREIFGFACSLACRLAEEILKEKMMRSSRKKRWGRR